MTVFFWLGGIRVDLLFLAGTEGLVANTTTPDIVITDGILKSLVKLVEGLKLCGLREERGVIIYEEDSI